MSTHDDRKRTDTSRIEIWLALIFAALIIGLLTGCSSTEPEPEPREALQEVMEEWEVPKALQPDVVLYTIASCAAQIEGLDDEATVDYMVEHAPVLAIADWVGDNHMAWGYLQVDAMDALCPQEES